MQGIGSIENTNAMRPASPPLLSLLEECISETVNSFLSSGLPAERGKDCHSALSGIFLAPFARHNVQ